MNSQQWDRAGRSAPLAWPAHYHSDLAAVESFWSDPDHHTGELEDWVVWTVEEAARAHAWRFSHAGSNMPDEEELVSAARDRCLRKINQFSGPSFRAWASTVANRLFISIARRCDHRTLTATDEVIDQLPGREPEPGEEWVRQETLGRVHAVVDGMSPRTKSVITLYLTGLTHPEIAKQVGIAERTVRWHVKQAVTFLRRALRA